MWPDEIVNIERRGIDLTLFVHSIFNDQHLRALACGAANCRESHLRDVCNLEQMARIESLLTLDNVWQID